MKFDGAGRLVGAPIVVFAVGVGVGLGMASAAAAPVSGGTAKPVATVPVPVPPPAPPPVVMAPPAPPAPRVPFTPRPATLGPLAEVPDAGPYSATLTGYVVRPSGLSMPKGTDLQLREHDVVLRARIAWFRAAHLPRAVTVHALDMDFTVPQTATLRLAVGNRGGDLAALPSGAQVFCEEPRHNTAKSLAQLAAAGLASIGTRLARDTDTCLVDADDNGDFDHAFIVGTKKAPDRHLVAIDPVAYEAHTFEQIPGDSELAVEFLDGGALTGPGFGLNMKVAGQSQGIAALHFFSLTNPGPNRIRVAARQSLKAKALPQTIGFGAAQLSVTGWDPIGKVATARINWDFGTAGFVVEWPPQYIYIYY